MQQIRYTADGKGTNHRPWAPSAIKVFLAKSLKAPLFVIKGTAFDILHLSLLFMANPSERDLKGSREENEQIELILVPNINAVPQRRRRFVRFKGIEKIFYHWEFKQHHLREAL